MGIREQRHSPRSYPLRPSKVSFFCYLDRGSRLRRMRERVPRRSWETRFDARFRTLSVRRLVDRMRHKFERAGAVSLVVTDNFPPLIPLSLHSLRACGTPKWPVIFGQSPLAVLYKPFFWRGALLVLGRCGFENRNSVAESLMTVIRPQN